MDVTGIGGGVLVIFPLCSLLPVSRSPAGPSQNARTREKSRDYQAGYQYALTSSPGMVQRVDAMMNGTTPHHQRKASSPMAPAFMVSAPGKVIVFGEHAVVHGKAAMAAAISLRSYLLVTTLSKSHRTITLVFPDIGLDHTWTMEDLPWSSFAHETKKRRYYDMVTSLDMDLVKAMQPHIANVSPHLPEPQRKIHQAAASSFLYLFLSLSSAVTAACIYTLRSTLPIGAGLGSSASICVCISAALLKQIHILSGPHEDQPQDEVDLQVERINRWAFVGELCIHGNPSGVDNTVSTSGKAVVFKRTNYQKPPEVTPLRNFPELPLLLVNTKQARSTSTEVAKVAAMKEKYPAVTEATLNSIDEVTNSAHQLIISHDFNPRSEQNLEHLGDLFRINHGHLVSLGVSHPKLEQIRELVDYADIGWTKLTGAGGGGCAITLLKSNADAATITNLEAKFQDAGFEQYTVTLGGDGVGVLYPAVLFNGTSEKGGEEIDQQKFLRADGADEIERLVGVGLHEKREQWKFWR
jgi:mevalonate kinase